MFVNEIMTAHPITIRYERPLREALELMERHGIKHLPAISGSGHVTGVLSDRDCRYALNSPFIVREKWQDQALINNLLVRAVMSPAPIIVEPQAPAVDAARLMLTHKIGCLPVMLGESLVGILTRSDLLIAFMTLHQRLDALSEVNPPNNHPPAK
jgi:acetoin utilization protein AcuB